MREPLKDKTRLEHIVNAIDIVLERTGAITREKLTADKVQFGGIVYYTLVIGEAAYNLSKAFKEKYKETDWQEIAKMRHNLVHGYYQVDPDILWAVVNNDLPPLREQVARYLAETNWEEWEKNVKVVTESAVHKSLIQTAQRMKSKGYSAKEITSITGLSADEIESA